MKLKLLLMSRMRFASAAFAKLIARKWRRNFYLYLAALFTLFALLDTAFLHITSEIRTVTFDAMVRYRLAPPQPDPDIVIVDINEASLSAMSKEYGRWPWPRQVLGEFVEQVEKQHPKAVVFDILFSDADVFNPKSDAYFDASIAKTGNTFFPMLLLDATSDKLRQVKIAQIPGAMPAPDETPQADASISMILPYFKSAIDGGRLGMQNVILDADGIVRSYPVYSEGYGWRLPSLPARLGREFGWPEPSTERMLLNWRGMPYSYKYASFADAYLDMGSKEKQRPQDEFKDKIIIIGSTAPNLYDVRSTPMAEMHPGVEVLATAIDNYKHGDSLRFPEGRLWYLLITLAIIWITAWAFRREGGRGSIDSLFGLSQVLLIAFSFASINFTDTYINLAGPVMLGIAYYTLARLYATATEKALERNTLSAALARAGELQATLLLIRFDTTRNVIPAGVLEKIRLGLKRIGAENKSVEVMGGAQKGLWGLFEHTIAISWIADAGDAAGQQAIRDDVEQVLDGLQPLLRRFLLHAEGAESHVLRYGKIHGGEQAGEEWRLLFAAALLAWQKPV
ncbi:MAG: CHASE2 domain-containing protein [Gallionellaceae bacterium]|nr:MAG: CHASE2 domain-containing protein [Gallionellaceae bacterium]